MHTCIHAYLHTCILAYLHMCIPAYVHTCIPEYLHTCIPAYLHTSQQYFTVPKLFGGFTFTLTFTFTSGVPRTSFRSLKLFSSIINGKSTGHKKGWIKSFDFTSWPVRVCYVTNSTLCASWFNLFAEPIFPSHQKSGSLLSQYIVYNKS